MAQQRILLSNQKCMLCDIAKNTQSARCFDLEGRLCPKHWQAMYWVKRRRARLGRLPRATKLRACKVFYFNCVECGKLCAGNLPQQVRCGSYACLLAYRARCAKERYVSTGGAYQKAYYKTPKGKAVADAAHKKYVEKIRGNKETN